MPIYSLPVRASIVASLNNAGLISIQDLLFTDPEDLLLLPNIGPMELVELRKVLEEAGFLPEDKEEMAQSATGEEQFAPYVSSWSQVPSHPNA